MQNPAKPAVEFRRIPLDEIDPPDKALRITITEDSVAELAADIAKIGVRQPLKVLERNGRYEILTGHRRFMASHLAGVKDVPALVVCDNDISAEEERWKENLFRKSLNPGDEAMRLAELLQQKCNRDVERLCALTGLSDQYVQRRLLLFHGHQNVFEALQRGELGLAVAEVLNKYPAGRYLNMRLADAVAQKWTRRQALAAWGEDSKILAVAGDIPEPPAPSSEAGANADLYRLECALCRSEGNPHMMQFVHLHTYCRDLLRDQFLKAVALGVGREQGKP